MADSTLSNRHAARKRTWIVSAAVLAGLVLLVAPVHALQASSFVFRGLVSILPIVVPGIALAAWIIASGAASRIAGVFERRTMQAVLAASLVGAVTPVCGVTVLPMMVGLLAGGVPLAPVMAFWLASPVTDPAMLATTAATLGADFAIGKTVAAFGLGIAGGAATALVGKAPWARAALRENGLAMSLARSGRCAGPETFEPRFWRDANRRHAFVTQFAATTRLMLICLIPAFAAEYAMNAALTPTTLASYVGEDRWWSIPAAVFVGAPAYIDGYAALPLTRGLIDSGMSRGAAMAFLVSGGVVSIWGAMAIAPVLKLEPFLLYLALALFGSMASGYLFGWAL